MQDFLAAFQEERYEPLATELLANTIQTFTGETAAVCVAAISAAIEQAAAEQATAGLPPVACLTVSVLYTAVYFGQPKLRLDFYTGAWPLAEPLYSQDIDAAWLFARWREHEDALTEAAKGQGAWVRSVHLESMRWPSVRLLAYGFSPILKYWLQDSLYASPALQALKREDQFSILFGEYQDWQTLVFALAPPADLASSSFSDPLRFRAYHGNRYRHQTFRQLDLSASRFEDCLFEDCAFDGVDLSDVLFHHCQFTRCTFRQVHLSGARFSQTQLRQIRFQDVQAERLRADADKNETIHRNLQFFGCLLDDIQLLNCRLPHALLTGSTVERLDIQGGDYSGSEFQKTAIPSSRESGAIPS